MAAKKTSGTAKKATKQRVIAPRAKGLWTAERVAKDRALISELVNEAKLVQERAYAPYSHYKVGAALLTARGHLFVGNNFENASFGACICAERNAIGSMIAAGESQVVAGAIVTNGLTPAAPCGICRQVLSEFDSNMTLWLIARQKTKVGEAEADVVQKVTLKELLPYAFSLSLIHISEPTRPY